MSKTRESHFQEDRLLQYVDGELTSREAAHVREHLEACWRCRAELVELEQTITAYVGHLKSVSQEAPDPPHSWNRFHLELERLAEQHQNSWWRRARGTMGAVFSAHRVQIGSLVTILLISLIVMFGLNSPVRISAAELLGNAAAQELISTAARHNIQVRTQDRSFTRAAIVPVGYDSNPLDEAPERIRELFISANYSWANPLSARSFAAWREHLSDREDEVEEIALDPDVRVLRIRTSTRSNTLEEAALSFRKNTYDVISGSFRFRGDEWVEIQVTATAPAEPEPTVTTDSLPIPSSVPSTPLVSERPTVHATSAAVQELRLFAALRATGSDLGEQVDMTRNDAGTLTVTATGLLPQRQEILRTSLAEVPEVDLRFVQPRRMEVPDLGEQAAAPEAAPVQTTALQLRVEKALGGGPAMEQFTDQVLTASANAIVRAYALRKLADRFPPEVEAGFEADDRALLNRLRRDHADSLVESAREIEQTVEPVLKSLGAQEPQIAQSPLQADTWQAATRALLETTSRTDRFLTMLVTGAGNDGSENLFEDTARAIETLVSQAVLYQSLASDVAPEGR